MIITRFFRLIFPPSSRRSLLLLLWWVVKQVLPMTNCLEFWSLYRLLVPLLPSSPSWRILVVVVLRYQKIFLTYLLTLDIYKSLVLYFPLYFKHFATARSGNLSSSAKSCNSEVHFSTLKQSNAVVGFGSHVIADLFGSQLSNNHLLFPSQYGGWDYISFCLLIGVIFFIGGYITLIFLLLTPWLSSVRLIFCSSSSTF